MPPQTTNLKSLRRVAAMLVFCLAVMPSQVAAQSELSTEASTVGALPTDSVKIYDRAFFDRFNPQTASDLIDRLPGFTLDAGAESLRGFGGAAGNVLIDGERPTSKSGGIEEALRRTPANQVERIEVIRGSAGLSEAAGQAVVANIIRFRNRTAGSYELKLERAGDGIVYPSSEVTLARSIGEWTTSTKANAFWERFPLKGPRLQLDANGELVSSQFEDRPFVFWQAFVSSEAKRALAGGTLTLTGRVISSNFLPDTERLGYDGRLPDETPDSRFFIDFDSIFKGGEFGIDWSRRLSSGWNIKLLSLSSIDRLDDQQDVTTERPVGTVVSGSDFSLIEDGLETIFRTAISSSGRGQFTSEFGGEVTFNRLDSSLALSTFEGDEVSVIDLPAANVTVEELRGEVFANLIWQAGESVSVEGGFALEASEISVSGDASNSQTFSFVKPFLNVIYDWRPGIQLRTGLRRTVGQLNFSEFAASASAEDDRFLGGNPTLGPDQTTRGSLTIDLRSDARGALNLELFHEWRDDVIEQVELPSGAFGADNAGDGTVWGLTANASLSLSRFISGGLFEIEADIRNSSFTDPFTGQDRDLSNVESPTVFAEFRQDLTAHRVSWGASYRAALDNQVFFADEESFSTEGETYRLFVETTRYFGLRINLALRNIGGRSRDRERRFFAPSRAGVFTGTELINRERGMFATITVSGQF
ncbi:MAG: TonB-dependent receptor [Pseudomonadota bacterium]